MPPKAKVTKEMVTEAAFDIARTVGFEQITARSLSQKLGCSTQPVLYHFPKIDAVKRAAYKKADEFHTAYLLNVSDRSDDLLLGIGLNYIRFAVEEPNLFRFLFQSGYTAETSVLAMIDSEELRPVLAAMQAGSGLSEPQMKEVFLTIALFAHGYASLFANNSLGYDEAIISGHLEKAFRGAVSALEEESK